MNNIEKRLEEIFERYNLVFWYDDGGKLRDEFEKLNIDAQKLEIKNNQFNIKYKILNAPKDSKFLVYSEEKEPEYRDNWLLDLQLRAYKFSADRASMVLNDLGIDIIYKPLIENHIEFFNAKSRVEAFSKLIEEGDDEKSLAFKMIASLLKVDPKIDHIIIKLMFKDGSYENICKFKLEKYLWENIKTRYKYNAKTPTLKDFGYKLLQNHFFLYVDKSKCELNKEAGLFIKDWMDSSSNKMSYEELSKKVQNELSLENLINDCDLDKLVNCDTYELCEQKIISSLVDMIVKQNFQKEYILDICDTREHTFWYEKYKNIYKALKSAVKLMDLVENTKFDMSRFDEGIEVYTKIFYRVDYHYRKYIVYSNNSEHQSILKKLDKLIEDIYLNGYLRVLNDKWQLHVKEYKNSNFIYQKDFYLNVVESYIKNNQKIFVIISDALRYECGVELKEKIVNLNRYQADIEPMVGVLPSFTQLGIASLLPNKTLGFNAKDDSVYIDGINSKGTKNRNKILKSYNEKSIYIDSESFLNFNKEKGREFVKNHQIFYIYHNEIDATGDKSASEYRVFDAVEDSFATIERVVKQITNFNGTNIVIVSDHGFLYQNRPTDESEFCVVKKEDSFKKFNRRFVIANKIEKNSCIDIFEASELNLSGDEKIALAKSINKIRLQGGGHRFVHGGAALQEMVIPLIWISKKRRDDIKDVEVSCIPISQITTNSMIISFYQEDVITQKIQPLTLKMAFYAKDGTLISNSQTYTFDSEDEYDRNREVKLKFDLKQNAKDYSGENVKLVMKKLIDGSSEEPIYKEYEVKLKLSFVNDFDDF